MGFGLAKGKALNTAEAGLSAADLPPLPDDAARNPEAARVDPRAWFPEPRLPLEVEIGSGKGTFLVQQAERQPGTNFLGIEWAREFWAYAADRLRRRGLVNVRILHADAAEFVHWRMPGEVCRVVHLYFPDPWPKSRHHKRRMVSDRFLADAWRVLEPGGELRVVTDHPEYWAWMEEHFARWAAPREEFGGRAGFERLAFERPGSAREGEVVGTNFERKYAREGRPFHAATLRKAGG